MRLRSRLGALAATLLLAVGGLVAFAAAPASAHCGGHGTHPDRYSAGRIDWANGTAIRRYPHISCRADGRGYPRHGIDVHCVTRTGAYWFYARNTSTGVNGWAREDALNINYPITIAFCNQSLSTADAGGELETVTLTG